MADKYTKKMFDDYIRKRNELKKLERNIPLELVEKREKRLENRRAYTAEANSKLTPEEIEEKRRVANLKQKTSRLRKQKAILPEDEDEELDVLFGGEKRIDNLTQKHVLFSEFLGL